jgi:hypothetical protein
MSFEKNIKETIFNQKELEVTFIKLIDDINKILSKKDLKLYPVIFEDEIDIISIDIGYENANIILTIIEKEIKTKELNVYELSIPINIVEAYYANEDIKKLVFNYYNEMQIKIDNNINNILKDYNSPM